MDRGESAGVSERLRRPVKVDADAFAEAAVKHYLPGGKSCAEAILMATCDALSVESELVPNVALGFAGGVGLQGRTCGAVTGAAMALGLVAGARESEYKKRSARDHRELVVKQWSELAEPPGEGESSGAEGKGAHRDEAEAKLDVLMNEAAEKKHHTISYAKPLLKTLLYTLALFDPISAVVLLFGEGLLGIHHHHQMHRLSRGHGTHRDAREILDTVHARIDGLDPARARAVVDFLHAHLRG